MRAFQGAAYIYDTFGERGIDKVPLKNLEKYLFALFAFFVFTWSCLKTNQSKLLMFFLKSSYPVQNNTKI